MNEVAGGEVCVARTGFSVPGRAGGHAVARGAAAPAHSLAQVRPRQQLAPRSASCSTIYGLE